VAKLVYLCAFSTRFFYSYMRGTRELRAGTVNDGIPCSWAYDDDDRGRGGDQTSLLMPEFSALLLSVLCVFRGLHGEHHHRDTPSHFQRHADDAMYTV